MYIFAVDHAISEQVYPQKIWTSLLKMSIRISLTTLFPSASHL